MPDMYFDVDVAITECPVNLLPLLDATDFKTIEDAVVYNAAGMALYWHFVTSAGAYTVTAVTPTTAGNYDWTDQGASGIYTIEIPASGGASINNDTEGYGWFTGSATGVLPWRGPVIGFRAAAINDALMDGGDLLDVSLVQVAGSTTNVAALATNVDAILTDTAEIGAAGAGLTAVASAANLSTVAGYLDTEIAAIKAKTDNLPAAPAATGDIPSAATVATAVLTTQMTESYRADGAAPTLAQAQCEMLGHMGEAAISGATKTIKKFDGTTTAATFTLDANPASSITRAT